MKDEPITMILSNLTWYRADEVLPDPLPEDMTRDEWNRNPQEYLVVNTWGDVMSTSWFNGWNRLPEFDLDTEIHSVVLWAELPDGKDLLKSIPKEA